MSGLPDLPAGVYRHYKGPLYLVLGYGHDANADTLGVVHTAGQFTGTEGEPLGERAVVVYVGLQLDGAHTGPRLAVRTAEDFHALLHPDDWTVCTEPTKWEPHECDCQHSGDFLPLTRRFTYVGPSWEGLPS